jgi:hypothetical protein
MYKYAHKLSLSTAVSLIWKLLDSIVVGSDFGFDLELASSLPKLREGSFPDSRPFV